MTEDGGGWTIFQRRVDSSVDFYRGWSAYKAGFGDLSGNLWIGLDHLHAMTSLNNVELYVYMESFEAESTYAHFTNFHVGDEASGYTLNVSGYSGDAGECLSAHNGKKFSTFDKDQDVDVSNCASAYKGAWWYGACHCSNLNGGYLGGTHESYADGVNWSTWKGYKYSLKTVVMKIRRK